VSVVIPPSRYSKVYFFFIRERNGEQILTEKIAFVYSLLFVCIFVDFRISRRGKKGFNFRSKIFSFVFEMLKEE
jgi:hypothetical protein